MHDSHEKDPEVSLRMRRMTWACTQSIRLRRRLQTGRFLRCEMSSSSERKMEERSEKVESRKLFKGKSERAGVESETLKQVGKSE